MWKEKIETLQRDKAELMKDKEELEDFDREHKITFMQLKEERQLQLDALKENQARMIEQIEKEKIE